MGLAVTGVFVFLPILAALVVRAVGAPALVSPLLVVVVGHVWVVLAGRITMRAERHYAAASGVPVGKGLRTVEGEQMLAERPHLVWVPFLVTASWIDILIGLVWLAFVDLRVMVGAVAVIVVAWFVWSRRPRRDPTTS